MQNIPLLCLDNALPSMHTCKRMTRLKRGNRMMPKHTKKKKRKKHKGKGKESQIASKVMLRLGL